MSTPSPDVTAELALSLLTAEAGHLPVRAVACYDRSDPYAVQVAFQTGEEVIEWTFARALLTEGLTDPVGQGDVRVWPCGFEERQVVCLALSSPSGCALFETDLTRVLDFLGRTYAAVPAGCEADHVDLDAELELLLSGR